MPENFPEREFAFLIQEWWKRDVIWDRLNVAPLAGRSGYDLRPDFHSAHR